MNRTNSVTALARKWYAVLNFPEKFDEEFETLLQQNPQLPETEISNYTFGYTPEDGGKNLLMCLYFCEALAEKYAKKEIPEEILLDTLSDIVLWTQTHYELTGRLGISEVNWLKYHFDFRLFRLGRLQFALAACDRDIPQAGVQKGDTVLAVHIPRGGPLEEKLCRESFARAREFFPRYFPETACKCFTCHSWLLDDTLRQFMSPYANALKFQRLFQIVDKEESIDILRFTVSWGLNRENLVQYQATNAFTKRVLEAVGKGEKFYIALGYIPLQESEETI